MTELRYNNIGGTLGAALTDGTGTTITFASAPNFATLTAGQTITLVIEPGTSNMEIVYLTAYTATNTTGTITRAAEDATNWPGVAHINGSPWSATPTVNDFTLTGDVTTSGTAATLVGTANVESVIRANSLNQFTTATGELLHGWVHVTHWAGRQASAGQSSIYEQIPTGDAGGTISVSPVPLRLSSPILGPSLTAPLLMARSFRLWSVASVS